MVAGTTLELHVKLKPDMIALEPFSLMGFYSFQIFSLLLWSSLNPDMLNRRQPVVSVPCFRKWHKLTVGEFGPGYIVCSCSCNWQERNSLVTERLQHLQMFYHIKAFSDDTRSNAPTRFYVIACLPTTAVALMLPSSEQQSLSSSLRKIDPLDDQTVDAEESTSTIHGNKVPEDFALHGETSGNKRVVDNAFIPESKCLKHAKQD